MSLKINTNIAAMNAHNNMQKTSGNLNTSLERLSSGLRINRAADDASGMAIADSLRSQSLGLGQAIRNANDGIAMVQTADGALEESINIVNTIKTKAIQAAQDGQTQESRAAIQADVNRLMEQLDNIARTTAFNNQKLLSGAFTNKAFQIGAYAQETVNFSIASSESTKIGHVTSSQLNFSEAGTSSLSLYSSIENRTYNLNTVDVRYDNSRENSLGAVADEINKLSDQLGITANAVVRTTTDENIEKGQTGVFSINGVNIGSISVQENDADGALVAAINQKSNQHGVFASVDFEGKMTLTSMDGRAISVTADDATRGVLGGTEDMSTLGHIQLTQMGAAEIMVYDRNDLDGDLVSVVGNLRVDTLNVNEEDGMLLNTNSELAAGSRIAANSQISVEFANGYMLDTDVAATDLVLAAGSVLKAGTVIGDGSDLTSAITIEEIDGTTGVITAGSGSVLIGKIDLAANTDIFGKATLSATVDATGDDDVIGAGSVLEVGSDLTVDADGSGITFTSGTIFSQQDYEGLLAAVDAATGGDANASYTGGAYTVLSDGSYQLTENLEITAAAGAGAVAVEHDFANEVVVGSNMTTLDDVTLKLAVGSVLHTDSVIESSALELSRLEVDGASMDIVAGSELATGTIMGAGSEFDDDDDQFVLASDAVVGPNFTLASDTTNSDVAAGSTLTLANSFTLEDGAYTLAAQGEQMTLAQGSRLNTDSEIADGSTLGGTATLLSDAQVRGDGMIVAKGSELNTGSVIKAGTTMTFDLYDGGELVAAAGTVLDNDFVVGADKLTIERNISLAADSVITAHSTLAPSGVLADVAAGEMGDTVLARLSDVDVTSQEGAQQAIAIADAALKSLNKVRADLGSVQNQLTSTISNISVTRVNITAAESGIRDVDFAEEAANFSKFQVLNQAGSFAMAQANATAQNVLSLLQG
ncbi:flagellin [Desulfurivibrio alkaliphilus]|uniref:Flagellin n=1 Tax=Desulfurivibrio alkaliphilus (strain DSM 19089 / UNIQEM U267 / AHT2) TaxID=589865 RepID=D6Z3H3_DESAT|nr:flagellin [Desulfurivibrio alkaliphilus]ADH86098.1 flagellin domain protein [Desulfurivibrio alkaliphilus AHT 2]